MKAFLQWTGIALAIFSSMGIVSHWHLTNNPHKLLIAVDSSYEMQGVWPQVVAKLQEISNRRYSQFALVTEKNKIHSWASSLRLGKVAPYAPRQWDKLSPQRYPEINEATHKYLITNAPPQEITNLKEWTVLRIGP
ncbi:hypothetical protein WDW89_23940 [Deltaproteobacteria bacterium TL4]